MPAGQQAAVKQVKTLVLFTANYPFGKGEEFLESEIPYLATAVERILLVPYNIDGAQRALPDNVLVDASIARSIPTNKGIRLWAAIRASLLQPEFYQELILQPHLAYDPRALRYLAAQLAAAHRYISWLKKHVESNLQVNSTLFYSYWFDTATLGLSLYSKSKKQRLPFISRAHRYDLYDEGSPIRYVPFRSVTLQKTHSVFSVSEDGADYLKAKHPEFASKVLVSRLGVSDPEYTTPASNDGVLRIASCSFITPVKRLPLIVKGLQVLAQRHPDQRIHWDHLGSGPEEAELIQLAIETLPNSVRHSFHGHLSNRLVLEFYRNNPVDAFLNVSESEGIPVSIMEAQSFGIPVIATDVGGVREIVDNDNGILLSEHPTPTDIANALETFIESDGILESRINSKASWRTRFNAAKNYPAFAQHLLRIVRGSNTEHDEADPRTHA